MVNERKVSVKFCLLFLFAICIFFTSCGTSKKVLYNPAEVEDLSEKMGFEIHNSDKNIPLYAEVAVWLGVPYKYAGLTRKGIDCSGFVHRIYRNVYGVNVSRSTSELLKSVNKKSKKKLRAGDLVFFATSNNIRRINHVGIYLKDGYFVHASTSRGVIVSNLNEKYYRRTWKKGGRLK